MPECRNCGSFVTANYVRVFAPNGMEGPRACPNCPDLVRQSGEVRRARSVRS